jgi:hypothetical protein
MSMPASSAQNSYQSNHWGTQLRRNQLTIIYPEGDAKQLHQPLLLLKRSRCLNVSAFCRAAIAEKLKQLEASK